MGCLRADSPPTYPYDARRETPLRESLRAGALFNLDSRLRSALAARAALGLEAIEGFAVMRLTLASREFVECLRILVQTLQRFASSFLECAVAARAGASRPGCVGVTEAAAPTRVDEEINQRRQGQGLEDEERDADRQGLGG